MPSKGETKADRAMRVAWVMELVAESAGRSAVDGPCRDWPWSRSEKGYGNLYWDGRARRVGHIVLALVGKPRPSPAHHQLHSCDRPTCVAPWHLRWGTNAENRAESIARGGFFTKLTDEQVLIIYRSKERQRDVAAMFGVTQRVVWQIKHGHTWSRVTGHGVAA